MQVALLRQGKASGRLVVLVQALTTPTLVAAAAADSQPAGSFVQGTDVPAVIQVIQLLLHPLVHFPSLTPGPGIAFKTLHQYTHVEAYFCKTAATTCLWPALSTSA